jgi:hypothetical protein
MRKISSIIENGEVLFIDDKGTSTTNGTEKDCLEYGFKFRNNKCYCYDTTIKPDSDKNKTKGNLFKGDGNFALGIGNKITNGINNVALGFKNLIQKNADNAIAIGKNAYAENFGEMAFSASKTSNRAKQSLYQFDGITTDNTATELFLGGHNGARLYINESYESAYYVEAKCIVLDSANNFATIRHRYAGYRYTNNSTSEILDTELLGVGDSSLSAVSLSLSQIASTPDYIEVKVTGLASTRLDYNVILTVTEVRYA